MDLSLVPNYAWGLLVASLVLAVVLDGAIAQIMFEIVRPVSKYVCWVGRLSKLAALIAWCAFFNLFWYPQFLAQDRPLPSYIPLIEWGVTGFFLVLAFTTMPRPRSAPNA